MEVAPRGHVGFPTAILVPLGPPGMQSTRCFLPCPQIPEHCRPSMEEGISLFSSLLNNKHFLIIFVHALEQQKDFAVRDR